MTETEKLERIFKILATDARIRIVQLLKGRALCVGALAARLNVSQAAVSQHLRLLRDADLVMPERRGYFIHYRLNERTVAKWRSAVEKLLSVEEPRARLTDQLSADRSASGSYRLLRTRPRRLRWPRRSDCMATGWPRPQRSR